VNAREVYEVWAPPSGRWTPWAKPAVFPLVDSILPSAPPDPASVPSETFTLGPLATRYRANARVSFVAVVVDLPGARSVAVGLALGRLGFRPVPLFNALAAPGAAVPMDEVVRALLGGAEELRSMALARDAPPAFLLDSRRAGEGVSVNRGMFDNRSVAFATDFPSARVLQEHGLGRVVLVQTGQPQPRLDLAQTLSAWQSAGLELALVRADSSGEATPLRVRPPGLGTAVALWWRRRWLRGNDRDGFGAYLPQSPHVG
jgi:hypothetical protein